VEVVRHETVRETSQRNALLRLANDFQERSVICWPIKEPESTDAAIQNVKDDASRSNPPSIWHGVAAIKDLANTRAERET